jgi:Zn-dependent M28 family amino/carboxypeptidase
MKLAVLISLVTTTFLAYSQADLQINISTKRIINDIFILASDSLEGRKFPSKGREKAAKYIASEFEKVGLRTISDSDEPYFQKIPVKYTDRGSTYLRVDGKWIRSGSKYSFSSSYPFTDSATLPLKFIGSNIYNKPFGGGDTILHITAKNIDQAIVKLRDLSSSTPSEYFAISLLGKKSATAKLITNERFCGNVQYPKGLFGMGSKDYRWLYNYTPDSSKSIKVFLFSDEIFQSLYGNNLKAVNKSLSRSVVSNHYKEQALSNLTFKTKFYVNEVHTFDDNVIGYIEGSDLRDEVVIICAHYDHLGKSASGIYYGADDNASGTAGVMELARMCAQAQENGFKFRRSIVFIAFGAEETGLNGSIYYANNPVFPLENTVMVINMDMIGRSDNSQKEPGYVNTWILRGHKKEMKKVLRSIDKQIDDVNFYRKKKFPERFMWYFGSDHYPFVRKGIPALVVNTGTHDDYHKVTDTPEKINYKNITNILKGLFVVLVEVANEPLKYPIKM